METLASQGGVQSMDFVFVICIFTILKCFSRKRAAKFFCFGMPSAIPINMNEDSKMRAQAIVDSLAGFCHALGQPATVLLSSVELLKMDGIDEQTRKEVLNACYDSVLEIKNLLAEMKNRREYLAEAYISSTDLGGTIAAMPEWSAKMPMANKWKA